MPAVGIAGAGLLGRLLALNLLNAGFQVTLFDRDNLDGRASCSWVAGGMLTPWAELEKAELNIARMGQRSLRLWPMILNRLPTPVFFQQNGSLVVAHRQDANDLAAFVNRVRPQLPQSDLMLELDIPGLAQLEPQLGQRFTRAVFFPSEGQLEPRDVLSALARALENPRVRWLSQTTVERIAAGEIQAGGECFRFDLVIDCRGLGAREDLPALRGVRGELLRVHAPEVVLQRPIRLMHPRYPLYIVPRPDQVFLIGATSIESDDMGPLTIRSSLELLSAAYSLHSGFAEARLLETAVHCRPAFPDNNPQIVSSPGLIRANGLYRHGYLIAPAFAEQVLAQIGIKSPLSEVDLVTDHS